jgi:hypothetical protein
MNLLTLLGTIIPALLPAVSDGLRGVIARVTGGKGAQPQNLQERIELMKAENDRLAIVAKLDEPGNVHMWVADLRALQRPGLATVVLVAYAIGVHSQLPADTLEQLGQYAQMVTFYLFGQWGYAAVKGGK